MAAFNRTLKRKSDAEQIACGFGSPSGLDQIDDIAKFSRPDCWSTEAEILDDSGTCSPLVSPGKSCEQQFFEAFNATFGRDPNHEPPADVERIKTLLESGQIPVNARDGKNCTVLHHFCRKMPDLETVEWLLSNGADVNFKNDFNSTPLIVSCMFGHFHLVTLLLKYGAEANFVNHFNETPLWKVCRRTDATLEVVKCLLEKMTIGTLNMASMRDINFCSSKCVSTVAGSTALHCATRANLSPDILNLLIKSGADVHALDSNNKTAQQYLLH